jgi:hypothetical protein
MTAHDSTDSDARHDKWTDFPPLTAEDDGDDGSDGSFLEKGREEEREGNECMKE